MDDPPASRPPQPPAPLGAPTDPLRPTGRVGATPVAPGGPPRPKPSTELQWLGGVLGAVVPFTMTAVTKLVGIRLGLTGEGDWPMVVFLALNGLAFAALALPLRGRGFTASYLIAAGVVVLIFIGPCYGLLRGS